MYYIKFNRVKICMLKLSKVNCPSILIWGQYLVKGQKDPASPYFTKVGGVCVVLVPPRITLLSTRKSTFRDEKKSTPFSLFIATIYGILFHIQLSIFRFNGLCACFCLQAVLPSKPYKPSLFPVFPLFSRFFQD